MTGKISGPVKTRKATPSLRVSVFNKSHRPLGTCGSKQFCPEMKNALAPMRKIAMVEIVPCALRYS